ncbi:MAG TPA: RNA-binding protein, partial [Hanamia sp.]|nr:RNA-binding protein [Hanamia sp.]
EGKNRFTINALPKEAQISVLNGMVVNDFDGDGNLDVLINGNDYGTEPILGRYDELNGLLLKGDGTGNFIPRSIFQSGIFIGGNGKALVQLRNTSQKLLIAASQNKGPLKIFKLNKNKKMVSLNAMDETVMVYFKDGRKQKREVGYGSSFLSQSGRFITVDSNVQSIEIIDNKGQTRSLNFP